MNKNKKIISASLALALGVSLLIPNAKANEEKSVENALKEPVKTSEKANLGEKSAVVKEENTIKKAPAKEGEETPANGEEKPADVEKKTKNETEKPKDKTEKPADKQEKPADGQEKPKENQIEKPKTDEVKAKEEKKVKAREFKMSEILNENTFEFIRNDAIKTLTTYGSSMTDAEVENWRRKENLVRKAKSIDEILKITEWEKEFLAKSYLLSKGIISFDEYNSDLIKIIDDTMTSNPKNPNRKNKKTGTTNTANTLNTGNKVSNAGENVQTGVGSLSAILGLLGASSLGLFKSKRK